MKSLLVFAFAVLLAGCADTTLKRNSSAEVLTLDNHGGFSHAGRRIEFYQDKSFHDIRYTDVREDREIRSGTYQMRGDRITIVRRDVGSEVLHRVRFDDRIYWVDPGRESDVTNPNESYFRQISLRQEESN